MNNELQSILELIKGSKRILVTSHENPDGDAIGSMLGLGLGLEKLGKEVVFYNKDGVPELLGFLPQSDRIGKSINEIEGEFDIAFALDCTGTNRAGEEFEKFLESLPGCVLIVSHDHRFLDNVATRILDVDYDTVTEYPGNYTAFVDAKRGERARREAEIGRREKEIAEQRAFIDRFRAKATKARQAQSRIKQIERIEIEPPPRSSRRHPAFRFEQARPSGKVALRATGLAKAFDGRRVLADVRLEIQRGQRVAVIGPNGIGKSTLLKILVGELEADAGKVEWGHAAQVGYFAQDVGELTGREGTVQSWLWEACPGEGVGFVRGRLGMALFSGDDAAQRLSTLSGGEAARLGLCRLGVERPNVLVLDEPTNHLDLEAIEALVEGLEAFDGTILFVSHDRWFVEALADRVVELRPDGVRDFHGGYRAYVEACGDDHLDRSGGTPSRAAAPASEKPRGPAASEAPGRRPAKARDGRRRTALVARRDRLLGEIEAAERRLEEIHARFADPGLYATADSAEVEALQREARETARRIAELTGEWEGLERALEDVAAGP